MKIFAHRGASKEAKENSMEAFRKALEIGVDAIELDCLITKDKIPIVTHYDDLQRLTAASGFVREKTLQELEVHGFPTLRQVLELIAPTNTPVIFDIKSQKGFMYSAPCIIAGLAQKMLPPDQILLTSFYWRHLWTLRRHFPLLQRGLILWSGGFRFIPIEIFDAFFNIRTVHPRLKWTEKSLVRRWKRKGFEVNGWVANTEEALRTCRDWGMDGVFTDDPRFAKEWLRQHGR